MCGTNFDHYSKPFVDVGYYAMVVYLDKLRVKRERILN